MGKMVFRCFYVTGVGDNVGSDVISPTTPSFRPSGVCTEKHLCLADVTSWLI